MKKRRIKERKTISINTNISEKTLYNWIDYGIQPAPDQRIYNLLKFLEMTCDELFFGSDLSEKELTEAIRLVNKLRTDKNEKEIEQPSEDEKQISFSFASGEGHD